MGSAYLVYANRESSKVAKPLFATALLLTALTFIFSIRPNMAEATAADGKMKDLSISETKKSKKDGAPQKAAKKPQQQKKKVGYSRNERVGRPRHTDQATD